MTIVTTTIYKGLHPEAADHGGQVALLLVHGPHGHQGHKRSSGQSIKVRIM